MLVTTEACRPGLGRLTSQCAAVPALTLCVIATVHVICTQILRFSLVDPWMHDKNDGFPLLYIRSHAARLPARCVCLHERPPTD